MALDPSKGRDRHKHKEGRDRLFRVSLSRRRAPWRSSAPPPWSAGIVRASALTGGGSRGARPGGRASTPSSTGASGARAGRTLVERASHPGRAAALGSRRRRVHRGQVHGPTRSAAVAHLAFSFLANHTTCQAFLVPTVTFRLFYDLVVFCHGRRCVTHSRRSLGRTRFSGPTGRPGRRGAARTGRRRRVRPTPRPRPASSAPWTPRPRCWPRKAARWAARR